MASRGALGVLENRLNLRGFSGYLGSIFGTKKAGIPPNDGWKFWLSDVDLLFSGEVLAVRFPVGSNTTKKNWNIAF